MILLEINEGGINHRNAMLMKNVKNLVEMKIYIILLLAIKYLKACNKIKSN